jgi:CheY-like chemotaxis protein
MLLHRLGYEADCVENGRECLEAALERPYDLILTDVDMPEMDGVECTQCLRQAGVYIPVIAVTASRLHGRNYYLGAGMDGYITKPINIAQLQTTVQGVYWNMVRNPIVTESGPLAMVSAQL